MKESIKLSNEEISEIVSLKESIEKNTMEFGIWYQEKIQIEEEFKIINSKEAKLRENLEKLKKENVNLLNKIINKYGEGDLNIKEGTFTPY